jgi:hypothetical protein
MTKREAELLTALETARDCIADNILAMLQSFCMVDGENKPIRETLEPDEAEVIARDEAVLAKIDAAIAKAKGKA